MKISIYILLSVMWMINGWTAPFVGHTYNRTFAPHQSKTFHIMAPNVDFESFKVSNFKIEFLLGSALVLKGILQDNSLEDCTSWVNMVLVRCSKTCHIKVPLKQSWCLVISNGKETSAVQVTRTIDWDWLRISLILFGIGLFFYAPTGAVQDIMRSIASGIFGVMISSRITRRICFCYSDTLDYINLGFGLLTAIGVYYIGLSPEKHGIWMRILLHLSGIILVWEAMSVSSVTLTLAVISLMILLSYLFQPLPSPLNVENTSRSIPLMTMREYDIIGSEFTQLELRLLRDTVSSNPDYWYSKVKHSEELKKFIESPAPRLSRCKR
eukprot:NODE_3889_length_1268_cov_38.680349_g3410_i0.p1 GENE.NODE_3889_length_1268_cov_38.680349_g3410_i0~~NODE_3889_length_1268_cov_38.680349_g3410_i0.p1  ORF type:complete len:344 (-),score=43.43 NODE_3889_length_1268_cov_38.680349_g3410_i0:236-1210(-)